jgi:hypothetical protein
VPQGRKQSPKPSKKYKLPGPETREETWKASTGQFDVMHAAFVESAKVHQQLLEQLAPGLARHLGVDVAQLTAANRQAFERIAKAVTKQWP